MKKGLRARLFAFALALCLCTTMVTPAFAASGRHNSSGNRWSFSNWWNNRWNHDDNTSDSNKSDSSEPKLKLVEDQSTVTEGTKLRASTYAVTSDDTAAEDDTTTSDDTVKYFPVTMYNYDTNTINKATHDAEAAKAYANNQDSIETWQGLYFSGGNPVNGASNSKYNGADYLGNNTGTVKLNESSVTYDPVKVNYVSGSGSSKYSAYINSGYYTDDTGEAEVTSISCSKRNNYYTWTVNGKRSTSSNKYITLYKKTDSKEYTSESYANWNYWSGDISGYTGGNYIYSGLVEKNLDKSNNIVFKETEPGLFRSDDTTNSYGKTIYTNVGLPFQYDKDTNYYTFDSSTMSARFTDSNPAGSNKNLTYSTSPQTISDLNVQGKKEGDQTSWLPFNNATSVTTDTATYHFGMQAVIPFSMTANGRMNAAEDNSEAIQFDFSGDDDVWVFVDGKLVLDIGGIHNELAGTMNFAENSWSVTRDTERNKYAVDAADINNGTMSGKLFNENGEEGVLGTDRETFAATTSHTLTVFYLERGAGASNCKIKFNLPMEDSVSVKKIVSDTDSKGDKISSDSQTNLDNHEFTFKLFKDGNPVTNTDYIVLDESNQPMGTSTTASNGTFKLKNKQTAKFVGQMSSTDGNTYYVQELTDSGWRTPNSSYTATAAGSCTEVKAANGDTSAQVKMIGSDEANDKLDYTFTNTLTHVDTTTVQPQDDTIVLDYGLPVQIDVLHNDAPLTGSGNTIEKMEITGIRKAGSEDAFSAPTNNDNALQLTYGKAYIYAGEGTGESRDSRIIYTPTEQATDLDKIEYQVKVTAKTSGGNTETATGTATVTVIPATSVYYEENFSGMVTFGKTGWRDEGTSGTVYQEPGVVGTQNDSPYGSDNAYMNSSGDSCGTSKHVNTTENGATFSYTFTGTGTSFFARTTNNSGYMRVTVYNSEGQKVYTGYRDTSYKTDNNSTTLYNIPVFTWNATEYGYGKYTVKVSIAKKTGNYGTDFWLDGIRVMEPMNLGDEGENTTIAQDAYAADGESNMTFATLRKALLADTTENDHGELVWDTSKGFVVFTDSNGAITSASEYQSNGPKEEVYLAKGQKVSFSLADWDADTNHLYLGIKAPMGAGTVQLGSKTINVNNTVDCYYDAAQLVKISQEKDADGNSHQVATLTITNPSDSIISLTNIKVTGKSKFVIIPIKDTNGVDPDDSDE